MAALTAMLLFSSCGGGDASRPVWKVVIANQSGFPGNVTDVRFDADGNPLLVTETGLFVYRDGTIVPFAPAPPPDVTKPLRLDDGTLLVVSTQDAKIGFRLPRGGSAWQQFEGNFPADFASLLVFDDHHGGLVYARPNYEDGMFALNRDGNYMLGSRAAKPVMNTMLEVRPDGWGRSWVDKGCDRPADWGSYAEDDGDACDGGRFSNLTFAVSMPSLSPSGAAYQIWQQANGSTDGVLMRARPDSTKWEIITYGNPAGVEAPVLYVSPATGTLYQFAMGGGAIINPDTGEIMGGESRAFFELEEPELP